MNRTFFVVGTSFDDGMILGVDGARNLRFLQWGDDPDTPAVETNAKRGFAVDGEQRFTPPDRLNTGTLPGKTQMAHPLESCEPIRKYFRWRERLPAALQLWRT